MVHPKTVVAQWTLQELVAPGLLKIQRRWPSAQLAGDKATVKIRLQRV
jgi:hypothetical protein